jgi:hypothetical protein
MSEESGDRPPAIFAGYPGEQWSSLAARSVPYLHDESERGSAVVTRAFLETFLEDCLIHWASDKPWFAHRYERIGHTDCNARSTM